MVYVIGVELAKGEVLQAVIDYGLSYLKLLIHLGIKQKGMPAHFRNLLAHVILRVLDETRDLSFGRIDAI